MSKDLTPQEIEAIRIWQNKDASRLLYNLEEARIEMEREKETPKVITTNDVLQKIFNRIKNGEMTVAEFENLLKNPAEIKKILNYGREKYARADPFIIKSLLEWKRFYKIFFGIELDTDTIRVPERVSGFDRLIVVCDRAFLPDIVTRSKAAFGVTVYDYFLKTATLQSDRVAKEAYAVWTADRVSCDADLRDMSVSWVRDWGIDIMTLEEWILLELFFISKYPKGADEGSPIGLLMDVSDTWTVCAGTRMNENSCPVVRFNWFSRTINISYVGIYYAGSNCGARRVIAYPAN